jgi:hypothetical protein
MRLTRFEIFRLNSITRYACGWGECYRTSAYPDTAVASFPTQLSETEYGHLRYQEKVDVVP